MGIPQVRISHTVPMVGMGTYRPIIFVVCHETRSIPFTHGFLQSKYFIFFVQIYTFKYIYETEPPSLGFMWLSAKNKKGGGGSFCRTAPATNPAAAAAATPTVVAAVVRVACMCAHCCPCCPCCRTLGCHRLLYLICLCPHLSVRPLTCSPIPGLALDCPCPPSPSFDRAVVVRVYMPTPTILCVRACSHLSLLSAPSLPSLSCPHGPGLCLYQIHD